MSVWSVRFAWFGSGAKRARKVKAIRKRGKGGWLFGVFFNADCSRQGVGVNVCSPRY